MKKKTLEMVQLAILSAIIIVMSFTPLGYLKTPALSITFISIPVCIGAMTMGPWAGVILGAVFGLTSFAQCFGLEAFGTMLCGINPFTTFIVCLVPRMLIGLFAGLVYKAFQKINGKWKNAGYFVAPLVGTITNTVFFITMLWAFFGNNATVTGAINATTSLISFFTILAGVNALVEIPLCTIVTAPIAKAVETAVKRGTKK